MRSARLVSGLVMFVFVFMHLANLALALISLDTAEAARLWFITIWRNPPATVLLYGSMLVHVALVLRALYLRRTFAMPAREAAQVLLGLLIPVLIAEHVVGTRIFSAMTGVRDTYEFVVRALWITTPAVGVRQAVLVVVTWLHACLGLHFWLRYRPWYGRAAPWLLVAAVLVPVLALLGFADAGQTIEMMDRPPLPYSVDQALIPVALERKDMMVGSVYAGFAALVAVVIGLRALRQVRERRTLVDIRYQSGEHVRVPRGTTVLEASRIGGIPHYSACGGKGRCSTCRMSP